MVIKNCKEKPNIAKIQLNSIKANWKLEDIHDNCILQRLDREYKNKIYTHRKILPQKKKHMK
jgi:hypothetical protein